MGWGFRWGRRGRPPKPRIIGIPVAQFSFVPAGPGPSGGPPVFVRLDEFEAFRLVYYEGLNQEEAARRMGVSRGTLWRCLASARRKIATALVERRPLIVTPTPPPEGV